MLITSCYLTLNRCPDCNTPFSLQNTLDKHIRRCKHSTLYKNNNNNSTNNNNNISNNSNNIKNIKYSTSNQIHILPKNLLNTSNFTFSHPLANNLKNNNYNNFVISVSSDELISNNANNNSNINGVNNNNNNNNLNNNNNNTTENNIDDNPMNLSCRKLPDVNISANDNGNNIFCNKNNNINNNKIIQKIKSNTSIFNRENLLNIINETDTYKDTINTNNIKASNDNCTNYIEIAPKDNGDDNDYEVNEYTKSNNEDDDDTVEINVANDNNNVNNDEDGDIMNKPIEEKKERISLKI